LPTLEKILRVHILCCQVGIAFGAGLTVENGRMLFGRRNVAKIDIAKVTSLTKVFLIITC